MLTGIIGNIGMQRILILDDEKLIRWSLDRLLAQDGYAVDAAATTVEALKLADRTEYVLIITDLEICGGQARSFFADMIAKQPKARIVTLTALARDQAERELGEIAIHAIVEKPYSSEQIRAVVSDAIGPSNQAIKK
jgi:DNA-binding response OmpR family regulator